MNSYFSDRELGHRPRSEQTIYPEVWKALVAIITIRLTTGALGLRFPLACPEGNGVVGTDVNSLAAVLQAEIPGLNWPLETERLNTSGYKNEPWAPDTIQILDLLEFVHNSVGRPIQGPHHDYFKHHHLTFDASSGQSDFRADVNNIFARNGLAYEFTQAGQIQRTLPPVLGESLRSATFRTGDTLLDNMLEEARAKFMDRDPVIRREGMERLWDSWERLKSMAHLTNKKLSITAILDRASSEQRFRKLLDEEATELNTIGNAYFIRHHELQQVPVSDADHIDYLFHRLFAMIQLLIRKNAPR